MSGYHKDPEFGIDPDDLRIRLIFWLVVALIICHWLFK